MCHSRLLLYVCLDVMASIGLDFCSGAFLFGGCESENREKTVFQSIFDEFIYIINIIAPKFVLTLNICCDII